MNVLNAVLAKLTSLVLAPFVGLPAQVALVVVAAVAGVLAALAFRYTSNQTALKRVADQVRANLLAMRLFREDLRAAFSAQAGLFKASILRLWYSLPPLAVLIVPFVLLLAQLAMWYEFRPLVPGEKALVEVRVAPEAWEHYAGLQLEPPVGVNATVPVRNGHDHVVTWRVSAQKAALKHNPGTLRFVLDGQEVAEKHLAVADDGAANRLLRFCPVRPGTSFWERLVYPGEPAFDSDSPVQGISIRCGSRTNTIFGLAIPWWATFFIVSIVAALLLKPFIKVQF
jgi:hypothetical protein